MVAPAAEGQFGVNITMNSWKKAMQAVGFNGFVEVALGGDMTAAYEADEWLEAYEAGEKKVTSCCPGFVNMVRKHYPELAGFKKSGSAGASQRCSGIRRLSGRGIS